MLLHYSSSRIFSVTASFIHYSSFEIFSEKKIYIYYNIIKIESDIRLISSQKWIIIVYAIRYDSLRSSWRRDLDQKLNGASDRKTLFLLSSQSSRNRRDLSIAFIFRHNSLRDRKSYCIGREIRCTWTYRIQLGQQPFKNCKTIEQRTVSILCLKRLIKRSTDKFCVS